MITPSTTARRVNSVMFCSGGTKGRKGAFWGASGRSDMGSPVFRPWFGPTLIPATCGAGIGGA